MTIHWLKTDAHHFQRIWDGEKNYEVRKDDRNYGEGDWLILADHTDTPCRAMRAVIAEVVHKFGDNQPGVETGYATLGLRLLGRIDGSSEDGLQLFEYSKCTFTSRQLTSRHLRSEDDRRREL